VVDWSGGLGFVSRVLTADVGVRRHGAFESPVHGALAGAIASMPSGDGTTLSVAYSIRPTSFLTLHGWYRDPIGGASAAYELPHHGLTMLTFRSRFMPHFRRGVFDVMGRLELESWSDGMAGLDTNGVAIAVPGSSVWSVHVQFRLVGAIIFWTWRNTQLRHYFLVPGFDMPRSLQRFGIMWEFTN
jgi:hypothetical protein